MQKIRYRIVYNRKKKLNPQGKALVQVEASLFGKRIYISTGVYLRPSEWDTDGAKVSASHPNQTELNAFLFQFMYDLERVELDTWKRGGIPTLQQLKDAAKNSGRHDVSFDTFARGVILKSDRRTASKDNLLTTVKLMRKFRPAYDWNDLTYSFLKDFEAWLREKGNSVNTVAKHLTQLRTLINEAIRRGLLSGTPFTQYRIKRDKSGHSYLTGEELALLEALHPKVRNVARVLDAFLFCCYVGLRYSDFRRLRKQHIVMEEGEQWLRLRSQKTGSSLNLPLWLMGGGKASALIEKWKGIEKLSAVGSNHDVNTKLRAIMQEAGIEKHITFHSARHTCATLMVHHGVPITTVQKILGHSKISTTQIYSEVHSGTVIKDLSAMLSN